MSLQSIATRYATAAFSVAENQGITEALRQNMELIAQTCEANRNLWLALKSPVIKPEKKTSILKAVFIDKIQPLTMEFLTLICKKNRAFCIPAIAKKYIELYYVKNNIQEVKVKTAQPMNKSIERKIMPIAHNMTSKQILLKSDLDPELIGGFTIQVGDKVLDASVKQKLQQIKRQIID